MNALDHKLWRGLGRLRGQITAITAVLACGVATYVTMRASYDSLLSARSAYYSTYRFADVFAQVKRAPESLRSAIAEISGVGAVQTRIVTDVTLDVAGLEEPATTRLVSIPERRAPILNDLFLRRGRYLDPGQRNEVLISEAFASANGLNPGDRVDAVVNGKWERLRIVGIGLSPEYLYEVKPGEIFPDNRRFGVVWMGREALEAAFDMKGAFNDVALTLSHGAGEAEVISRLDHLLERYGSLGAYGRGDQLSFRFIDDELAELRTTGLVLPTIFLAVVAFLLHVVMSRLVGTERGQIAVLKAFGYGRWEIAAHYLKFALLAALPGSLLGIAGGLWLAYQFTGVYARYFHFPALPLEPQAPLALVAVAIAAGSACVGALSAARRAATLPPAEAMHAEPPEDFRAGMLERSGLASRLSPGSRMIARNLARRPWKALAAGLGIALAVAILVVGRYAIDSVNYIVDLQFRWLQREDVTVTFQEPRPARILHALAQWPGVLRAEPFREVPARLRFGHRSRRSAILGMSRDRDLRPLLNRGLRPVELPADGLVLNARLGEILGVRLGDQLRVEVLEGARPVRLVTVAGWIDEPIGLGAFMDATALQRLMREAGTVSGAYLAVDSEHAAKLYSFLKRTPAVRTVSVKEAAWASFWKSYGETIWISTTMLVGFASVIAFGIVYNGARIALSERSHELASLRILGYTRAEVARILLVEQAILTALAIPAGFAAGYALAFLTSRALARDLVRLPLVIGPVSYAYAAAVVVAAAVLSGCVVARRLARMDLTAVLKSRE
jgi:putative ABC transport system permease protein